MISRKKKALTYLLRTTNLIFGLSTSFLLFITILEFRLLREDLQIFIIGLDPLNELFIVIITLNMLGLTLSLALCTNPLFSLGWGFRIIIRGTLALFLFWGDSLPWRFIPTGISLAQTVILTFLETISYLIARLTLGLRLLANLTAGQFLSFMLFSAEALFTTSFLGSLFWVLERVVALLQAYIFVALTTLYLIDIIRV